MTRKTRIKIVRIAIFIYFAIFLYGSINCLIDAERALEHASAWISMYICIAACVFAALITDI